MANTYTQIYIQIVFAVKYRRAMLDSSWRNELFGVIGNLINEGGCKNLIVNGVDDHVHCLFAHKPVVTISELMKSTKARSSKFVNDRRLTRQRFEWQVGYGAFSYRRSDLHQIFNYIKNQEAHHNKISFREEYVSLLKEFEIDYDEQYIFHEPV